MRMPSRGQWPVQCRGQRLAMISYWPSVSRQDSAAPVAQAAHRCRLPLRCLYLQHWVHWALRDANLYISPSPIGQSLSRPELPLVSRCLQAAVTQTTGGVCSQAGGHCRVCRAAICSHLGERLGDCRVHPVSDVWPDHCDMWQASWHPPRLVTSISHFTLWLPLSSACSLFSLCPSSLLSEINVTLTRYLACI